MIGGHIQYSFSFGRLNLRLSDFSCFVIVFGVEDRVIYWLCEFLTNLLVSSSNASYTKLLIDRIRVFLPAF